MYLASVFKGEIDLDPSSLTDIHINQEHGDNIFVVKLDDDGNYIWGKSFQSENPEPPSNRYMYFSNIKVDGNNDLVITGRFNGTIDFDFSTTTSFYMSHDLGIDAFILKINEDGDFVWAKQFEGGVSFYIDTITFDTTNNIIMGGGFSGDSNSPTDFDPGLGTHFYNTSGSNDQNLYILKLSQNGDFVWVKVAEEPSDGATTYAFERIKSIVTNSNNDIIFSGHFKEVINFEPTTSDFILNDEYYSGEALDYKALIGKLGEDGDVVWVKKVDGEHSVFTSGNGNAASSHNILSKNDLGQIYYGLTFDGNLEYEVNGITYIINNSNVSGWSTLDLVFFQVDTSNGSWINAHTVINNSALVNRANLYDLEFVNNDLFITGDFSREVFFDEATSLIPNNNSNSSAQDVFVVKYEDVNALGLDKFKERNVLIFPNPTSQYLNIEANYFFNKILIYDLNGRVVKEQKLDRLHRSYQLNLEYLDSGMYFIEIGSNNVKYTLKFIKQ